MEQSRNAREAGEQEELRCYTEIKLEGCDSDTGQGGRPSERMKVVELPNVG